MRIPTRATEHAQRWDNTFAIAHYMGMTVVLKQYKKLEKTEATDREIHDNCHLGLLLMMH